MMKLPDIGFNGKKLKPLLNQSIIRIQMVKQKRSANIQAQMKLVAKLLGDGQVGLLLLLLREIYLTVLVLRLRRLD